jgi:hypothetical protein
MCNSDQSVSTVWHTCSWHKLLAQANNSVVTAALHCSCRPYMFPGAAISAPTASANVCLCVFDQECSVSAMRYYVSPQR